VPPTRRITSRQHPFVQRCRAVADRRAGAAILLDGVHLVREALRAGLTVEGVLTEDRSHDLDADLDALGIPRYEGTTAVLAAASPVRTPSGIVAIAEWTPAAPDRLLAAASPLVVGLVDVQDPGNVGGVIRSAHALGATGVLALGASADPAGWKALRGSMGSTFHLAVGRGPIAESLDAARAHGLTVAATVAHGGVDIDRTDLAPPLLLLAGNEGAGLPPDVLARTDRQVRIPLRTGVESLNVAVTTALVVWEIRRREPARGRRVPA
jgi:TrmH family RNA methyltransferase